MWFTYFLYIALFVFIIEIIVVLAIVKKRLAEFYQSLYDNRGNSYESNIDIINQYESRKYSSTYRAQFYRFMYALSFGEFDDAINIYNNLKSYSNKAVYDIWMYFAQSVVEYNIEPQIKYEDIELLFKRKKYRKLKLIYDLMKTEHPTDEQLSMAKPMIEVNSLVCCFVSKNMNIKLQEFIDKNNSNFKESKLYEIIHENNAF